jgi:hypothetical protein
VRVLEAMRPGETLWDASVGGFYAVCGVRSVILKLAIDVTHGKTVRRTVGKWHPGDNLRGLRRQAGQLRAQVTANPEAFTNQGRARAPVADPPAVFTVRDAVARYLPNMAKSQCAPKSIAFTGGRLRMHLADWMDLPLATVSADHCIEAHDRISVETEVVEERRGKTRTLRRGGKVTANKVLRDFRAVWNLAVKQRKLVTAERCPVGAVTFNPARAVSSTARRGRVDDRGSCRGSELDSHAARRQHARDHRKRTTGHEYVRQWWYVLGQLRCPDQRQRLCRRGDVGGTRT